MRKTYPCPNNIEPDCGYPACAHAMQCENAANQATMKTNPGIRAWRSTVSWFVAYQAACSNHGGRAIHALPEATMEQAIEHCIRWREEGATGKFTITTRRKLVEEITLEDIKHHEHPAQ